MQEPFSKGFARAYLPFARDVETFIAPAQRSADERDNTSTGGPKFDPGSHRRRHTKRDVTMPTLTGSALAALGLAAPLLLERPLDLAHRLVA